MNYPLQIFIRDVAAEKKVYKETHEVKFLLPKLYGITLNAQQCQTILYCL